MKCGRTGGGRRKPEVGAGPSPASLDFARDKLRDRDDNAGPGDRSQKSEVESQNQRQSEWRLPNPAMKFLLRQG